jgi:hypothetical protein
VKSLGWSVFKPPTNNKKDADDDNDNSRDNPSYDFSIGKITSIEK